VLDLTETASIRVQNRLKQAKQTKTASPVETVCAKSPKHSPDTITRTPTIKEVAVEAEEHTAIEHELALEGDSLLVLDEDLLNDIEHEVDYNAVEHEVDYNDVEHEVDYNDGEQSTTAIVLETPEVEMAMVEVELHATQNGTIAGPATTD
jgi:hypothetical protein